MEPEELAFYVGKRYRGRKSADKAVVVELRDMGDGRLMLGWGID